MAELEPVLSRFRSRKELHRLLIDDQDLVDLGRDLIDDPDAPCSGGAVIEKSIAKAKV